MPNSLYNLNGSPNFPQIEPAAAFWLRSPVPRAISLEEVRRELDHVVPELIGKAVGNIVIRQLNESGIRPVATPDVNVPNANRLREIEADF